MAIAAEQGNADIYGAKKWTARSIICPDLFLITERCGRLLADNYRIHPGIHVASCRGTNIIGARDRYGFSPSECLLRGYVTNREVRLA